MTGTLYNKLSRLERRIMDAIYHLGSGAVADVVEELDGQDIYHSIRVTMAELEKKGFLRHKKDGRRNIYSPTVREERARKSAMDNLLRTFFDDSPVRAMLSFLDRSDTGLSPQDLVEIRKRIEAAERQDD